MTKVFFLPPYCSLCRADCALAVMCSFIDLALSLTQLKQLNSLMTVLLLFFKAHP